MTLPFTASDLIKAVPRVAYHSLAKEFPCSKEYRRERWTDKYDLQETDEGGKMFDEMSDSYDT